jgi:predicted transposase YdaD
MYDSNIDRKIKRQQLEQYSVQRKVDQTVVKVIASVTNVNMDIFEKEGDVTVCELWDEVRQEGRTEGRAEGEKKGEKKGEDKLAKLINKLMNENRFDDVTRATTDAEYRKTLYTEYKINA